MNRGLTGRYDVSLASGEAVSAFVPHPLPPIPPLDLNNSRQQALERAYLACGRLDGVSALLPEPDLFLYGYVRREAVLSSQIEGTQSSLSDLLLFELDEAPGVPFHDVIEISNYVAALEHGIRRLQTNFPLSNRLIREVHEKLLSRGRGAEKSPGEFRRSQNWIGGTRPGNAQFVPPPPDLVEECMASLERFIHDDTVALPGLIKAAIAHVQFETIHPFLDGNGRVGRLLITLMLHDMGILRQPLLYLSLYFKQHRNEYYRLLDTVRYDGNWEAWLDFFVDGVAQTAGAAVDTAHRLLLLFREDEQQIQTLGRSAANALRIVGVLRKRPLTTINELVQRTGLSHPTVGKICQALIKLSIMQELTGQQRNRLFVYNSYSMILNEGTEPL